MFEIGNTLREARLRRHLDILECEAETKIRAKYLRAMEDEQFDLMPSPTYVRGFLRTYADFLDLDGQLVLDEYESRFGIYESHASGGPEVEPWRNRPPRTDGGHHGGGRPGAGRRRPPRRRRTELRLLWLAIGGVMAVALLVWMGVGGTNEPAAPVPGSVGTGSGTTTLPAGTVDDPDTSLTEAPARPPVAVISLAGTGINGSWVAVRAGDADGRQVWEAVLSPGTSKTFRVRNPIHITTGNPAELVVTIDGETQELEGATGRWILSKDGAESAD